MDKYNAKETWVKEYLQVAHRICFNLYDPLFESEPCDYSNSSNNYATSS